MRFLVIAMMLVLAGCSSTSNTTGVDGQSDTMEIIRSAAESHPEGVSGEYVLSIKASAKLRGRVFLNTEDDYRDPRNVSVSISPKAVKELERLHSMPAEMFFKSKIVKVNGVAKKQRINLIAKDGTRSGAYYFQTHVMVDSSEAIQLVM